MKDQRISRNSRNWWTADLRVTGMTTRESVVSCGVGDSVTGMTVSTPEESRSTVGDARFPMRLAVAC